MSPCRKDFEHARHVRFGSNSVVESHRDRSPLQPDERKSPAKLANPSRAMCGRPRVGKSNFALRCWSNRAAPGNWPSLRPTPPAIAIRGIKAHRPLLPRACQCHAVPYCIRGHTKAAMRHGATREELMEAIWVAAEMRAGGAYTHSALALDEMEKASPRE